MTKNSKSNIEIRHQKRRKALLSKIKGEAALFCSAPEALFTRDQHYPYRQNSDFFYLTGIQEKQAALLLLGTSTGPSSILFVNERNIEKEKWEVSPMGLKAAKKKIKIDEVRNYKELKSTLSDLVKNCSALHYAPGTKDEIDSLVWNLFKTNIAPRPSGPHTMIDSRLLTSQMRIKKDADEITRIKHACDLTAESFCRLAPKLKSLKSELHAAKVLETEFSALGADSTAFNTIVASGKNATVLHHSPTFQPLWKKSPVLIDAGASFNGYSADMTRTMPVTGSFGLLEAQAYDVVLSAFFAALKKAKPGSSLEKIHKASVLAICKGLIELGVLKGSVKDVIKKKAYLPYFMHGTSHWLGIDVHDIAPIHSNGKKISSKQLPLEAGNLITIEPGLYFDPKDKTLSKELRGLGIRIEDTVLITADGHELLTDRMPKDRKSIEAMIQER